VLEWRPRLIVLVLVLVAFALVGGFVDDLIRDNWEW